MNEYGLYISGVSYDNLKELANLYATVSERRILELREIAELSADLFVDMTDSGFSEHEIISFLSGEFSLDSYEPSGRQLPEHTLQISAQLKGLVGFDRAAFAMAFVDVLNSREIKICERSVLPEKESGGIVSYMKNALADEAYDVFSVELDSLPLKYADSMRSAASAVSQGDAAYCLLPLEDRGARIASVSALISAFDLKINSVTSVFGPDGSADMKYALLSRGYRIPTVEAEDDVYLEFKLTEGKTEDMAGVMNALLSFSHTVYRIGTDSDSDGGLPSVNFVIKDGGGGFTAMLVFLALFYPTANIIGMYKNLE